MGITQNTTSLNNDHFNVGASVQTDLFVNFDVDITAVSAGAYTLYLTDSVDTYLSFTKEIVVDATHTHFTIKTGTTFTVGDSVQAQLIDPSGTMDAQADLTIMSAENVYPTISKTGTSWRDEKAFMHKLTLDGTNGAKDVRSAHLDVVLSTGATASRKANMQTKRINLNVDADADPSKPMPAEVYVLVMQQGLITIAAGDLDNNGKMDSKAKFVSQFKTLLSASGLSGEASTSLGNKIATEFDAGKPIYVIEYADTDAADGNSDDHHFREEIKIDVHYSLRTMLQGHGAIATQFPYIAPTVSHQEWLKDAPAPVTGVGAAFDDANTQVKVTFTPATSGQWAHSGTNDTSGSVHEGMFDGTNVFGDAFDATNGTQVATSYTDTRIAKGIQRTTDEWKSYGVDEENVDYYIVIREVHDKNSCGANTETDKGRAFHARGMAIGNLQSRKLTDGTGHQTDEKGNEALTVPVLDVAPDSGLYMLRDRVYEVFILTALSFNQTFSEKFVEERLADLEGHAPGALIAIPKANMALDLKMWQEQYRNVNDFVNTVTVYAAGTMTHTTGYCTNDINRDVKIELTKIETTDDLSGTPNWENVAIDSTSGTGNVSATSWKVKDDVSGDAIATLNQLDTTGLSAPVYKPLAITLANAENNKYRALRLTFTAEKDARLPIEGTYTEKTAETTDAADSRMTQFVYFMPVKGPAHSHSVGATATNIDSEDHHKFTTTSAKGAAPAGALAPWYVQSITRAHTRIADDVADTYDNANTGEMVRTFGTAGKDTVTAGSNQTLAGMTALDYKHMDNLVFTHNKVAMGQTSMLTSTIGKQLYPEPMFNSGLDNTYQGHRASWISEMTADTKAITGQDAQGNDITSATHTGKIGSTEPIGRLVSVPTSDGTEVTVKANAAGHDMKAVTLIDLSSGTGADGAEDTEAYKTVEFATRGDTGMPWKDETIKVKDVLSGASDYNASGLLILESKNGRIDNTHRPKTGVAGASVSVGVSIYFLDRAMDGTISLDADFGMKPAFADIDVHLTAGSIAAAVADVGTRV